MFAVSCYKSSDELFYYLWGETGTARVVTVRPELSPWGNQQNDFRVTFEFHNVNTGTTQEGFLTVDELESKLYPKNSKFEVEYYDDSIFAYRLQGEQNFYGVEFFLWSLGGTAIIVIILTYVGILEERQRDNRKWWIR